MDKIEFIVKKLNCSIAEAKDVIQYDKKIDKNETNLDYDLNKEQKAFAKKMTISETHKKTTRKPVEKKIDIEKKEMFAEIEKFLKNDTKISDVKLINPNREINFTRDNKKFKILLTCPRK